MKQSNIQFKVFTYLYQKADNDVVRLFQINVKGFEQMKLHTFKDLHIFEGLSVKQYNLFKKLIKNPKLTLLYFNSGKLDNDLLKFILQTYDNKDKIKY